MITGIPPGLRSLTAGSIGRLRGFGGTRQVNPALPVATSISLSPASASFALGKTQQFTAIVRDQFGQNMGLTATWSSNSGNVTVGASTGLATGAAYGSATLTATYQAINNTASATVQQPTKLAIVTQPSGGVSGSALTTQPIIELRDVGSNQDAEVGRVVTVTILSGAGSLSGITSVATDTNGRAVFTNLMITATTPPSSFTLAFASSGLTGINANSVTVTAPGAVSQFFNSTEPGGDGSNPNYLLTDDFERGYYFLTVQSLNPNVLNAGWNATPYGEADPLGTNFGRAGQGVGGGYCVSNGGHTGAIGQARAMADHSLFVNTATEIYWRYYVKPLTGYLYGQEKALTFNRGPAGVGGIFFGTLFFGLGGGDATCTPTFLSVNQGINLFQNQGNDLVMSSGNIWYCLQMHLKLNGNGTDVVELYGDACGTDGMTHPGSMTLRMRHTNASLRPAGDSTSTFGSVWVENWANPAAVGEMYYDQIIASTVGPIGFKV